MKYLVTGGSGFIGSHVCDALIARGDSVIVLDNQSTGNNKNLKQLVGNPKFAFFAGTIVDSGLVEKLVESVDYVLHFAAAVGVFTIVDKPLESLQTNVRGTENVLAAAAKFKKPVFLASTSEIYGKNSGEALHEESDRIVGSPLKSRWSYSEAKALDESLAIAYHHEIGLQVRIARYFNTVGPRQVGQYGMVVPRFVSAALKNESLSVYGDGSQSRCFCHVADAVDATLRIIDSSKANGDVFNVGNDSEITISELASTVISRLSSSSSVESVPYEKAYGAGFEDMQRRVPDISKIKRVLGWSPSRNLDQIIDDIAVHMREN